MKPPSEPPDRSETLREKIIGLGERSFRKSYYPELQQRLAELERFRVLLDQSNDAIFLLRAPSGALLDVNETACRQLGYTREALLTQSLGDLLPLADFEEVQTFFSEELRGGGKTITTVLTGPNNREMPVEMTLRLVELSDGVCGVGVARDITKRKLTEEALKQSESRYRAIFEHAVEGIFQSTPEGRFTSVNSALARMLGYESAPEMLTAITDLTRHFYVDPNRRQEFQRLIAEQGQVQGFEYQVYRKDGSAVWISEKSRVLYDESGKIMGYEGFIENISARKEAERTLQEEAIFRSAIINNAAEGLCVGQEINAYPYVRFTVWNQRMTEITGYTMEEINRLGWHQTMCPDAKLQARVRDRMAHLRQGDNLRGEEWEITRVDGEQRVISISTSVLFSEDGVIHVLALILDVTARQRAEEARRVTYERLELALKGGDLGTWDWNVKTSAVTFNERWGEMLGYRLSEVEPHLRSWEKLVHPEDMPAVMEVLNAHLEGKTPLYETEHRLRHKSGAWVWVLDKGKVIERDAKGKAVRACGTHLDITERKEAQKKLLEAEQQFRSIFDCANDGILIADPETKRFHLANPRIAQMLGYTQEELQGLGVMDLHPPDRLAEVLDAFDRQLRQEFLLAPNLPVLRKDGSVFYADISASQFFIKGKLYLAGIFRDITERKRAREELQKLAAVVQYSSELVSLATLDGQGVFLNEAGGRMLGIPPEEVHQHHLLEVIPQEYLPLVQNELLPALRRGETWQGDLQYLNLKTGARTDVHVRAFSIPDLKTGVPRLLANISLDITERRRAAALFKNLIQEAPIGVFIVQQGKFKLINPRFEDLTGYQAADLVGQDALILVNEESREALRQQGIAMLKGRMSAPFQFQVKTKTGETRWILEKVTNIEYQGERAVLGYFMDITELKEQQDILRREKEKYQTLSEESPLGIAIIGKNGNYQYLNPKFIDIFGYTLEDIHTGREWFARAYPDKTYRQQVLSTWTSDLKKAKRGEARPRTFMVICKDGSAKTINFRPVTLETGDQLVIYEDITERQRAEEELRLKERLLDGASDSIFLHDLEGHLLYVNRAAYRDRGYEKEELLVQNLQALIAPEFAGKREAFLSELLDKGEIIFESAHRRQDGSVMPVEIHARTIDLRGQQLILSAARDITARKQVETALKKSELEKQLILESVEELVAFLDKDLRILWVNRAAGASVGENAENLVGRFCYETWRQRTQPCELCPVQEVIKTGRPQVGKASSPDGRWWSIRAYPAWNEQGALAGIVEVTRDITAQRQAEQNLLKEKILSDNIINSLPGVFYLFDETGRFRRWNANFEEVTGHTVAEFAQLTPLDLVADDHKPLIAQAIQEAFAKGANTVEADLTTLDGRRTPYFFTGRRLDLDGVPCIIGMGIDIRERKKGEEELRQAAQKWRTTFDAMRDAVSLLDLEGLVLQCNQAMADLVGKPFADIIGHTCCEFIHGAGQFVKGCPFVRTRQTRSRETLTFPSGDRWLHVMADPILSDHGDLIGSVHIIADITDYHLATQKIRDLNTLLKAIKEINESLLRVESETELFQQTCELLLRVPYVRFAWIGLVEPDSFTIKPAAWAGAEEGYLSVIKVAWDDSPFGQGPTGEAFRTGRPFIRRNIATDPHPNPWRDEALNRGFQSSIALPLIHQEEVIGILKVYSEKTDAFGPEETEFLNQVAGDIAVGVKSLRLELQLEQSLRQLQVIIHQTVETMGSIVETRDPYTAGHQQGVAHLAGAIAAEMGFEADRLQGLRVAGLLHDIGKMMVPAEILSKPVKLSEVEFQLIKYHSQAGANILAKIDFPWPVAQMVLQHHERLNGSGYPQGLMGPDILLEAKILAVADVVEAMASHRPYRPALGIDAALEEIIRNKGILYDSEVVEVCVKLFMEGKFAFDA